MISLEIIIQLWHVRVFTGARLLWVWEGRRAERHGTRAAVRLEQLARIDSVRWGTVRPSIGSAKNKQLRLLLTRNYHIISANDGLLIMEIESEKERKRDSDAASGTGGGVSGYSVEWNGGAPSLKCLPEFGGSPTRLRLRKGRLATWTQSDVLGRGYWRNGAQKAMLQSCSS